jgi:hypothetical protein
MEVSGQLHAPAALPPVKEPLLPIGQEAGWTPEPFCTRWWRKNSEPPPEFEPPIIQPVAQCYVSELFLFLTTFISIPNSVRIIYNTSIFTESQDFSKSLNNWCSLSFYSNLFSSIWRTENIWSIVDLLCQNPHCLSPRISSAFGLNLEKRILGKKCMQLLTVIFLCN